jgi:hypothetical protein
MMSIHRAVPNPHIRVSTLIVLGLAAAIMLAGCNFQRQSEGTPQSGPGTQAVVQPTSVLGPTNAPATAGVVEPTGSAPASTVVAPAGSPTIGTTSETDALATEVDQDLQQLDDLNNSADPLDDQP